jgi:hypothetical protein
MAGWLPVSVHLATNLLPYLSACLSVCPPISLSVCLVAETQAWKSLIPKPAIVPPPELVLSASQRYFSLRLILTLFSHLLLWLPTGRFPRYFRTRIRHLILQCSCEARYRVPCHTVRFWEASLNTTYNTGQGDGRRLNSEGLHSFFSSNAVWGIESSWMRWVGETGNICEILVGKH